MDKSGVTNKMNDNCEIGLEGHKLAETIEDESSVEECDADEERKPRPSKYAALLSAENRWDKDEYGGSSSPMIESDTSSEEREKIKKNEKPMKHEKEKGGEKIAAKKRRRKRKRKCKVQEFDGDLDHLVQQMGGITVSNCPASSDISNDYLNDQNLNNHLKIDSRALDPDVELRRRLGKTFGGRELQQKIGRGTAAGRTLGKMVKSKVNWPPPRQLGFYMVLDELSSQTNKEQDNNEAVRWYRFRHGEAYQHQQQMFWFHQRQMDHQTIINELLAENPYHLDSLLLLAEVNNIQEDFQQSRDAIERGIFACEFAFHSGFQPLSADHRLDYSWRENRAFFLLLHRHMLNTIQRRCFYTGLQFAKLLFVKDPEGDPLAVLLLIDSLALRASNPEFLLAFYAHYRTKKLLNLLPNFLFSLALAHRMRWIDAEKNAKKCRAKGNAEKLLEQLALAKSSAEKADECLREALLRFPFVLSQILDNLQVKADPKVERNAYLNSSAIHRETKGLRLLVRAYVHHSEELWRDGDTLSWLETATHRVLPQLDKLRTKQDEWAEIRKNTFLGVPDNIVRHCMLHGIPHPPLAELFLLRSYNSNNDIESSANENTVTDPCPPLRTHQDYAPAPLEQLLQMQGIETAGNAQQQGTNGGGLVGIFLRSLLPQPEQERIDHFVQNMGNHLDVRLMLHDLQQYLARRQQPQQPEEGAGDGEGSSQPPADDEGQGEGRHDDHN